MCVTHYHRWSRETKADRDPPGICRGCGAAIPRTGKTQPAHYCGPDCRPRCSVEGCVKPRHGLTYCSAHHTRWKRCGDPLAPLQREPNVGSCSVDGCDDPSRKRSTGRLQRTDTIWCPDCGRTSPDVQRFRRYGVTKDQYEAAQAAGCPICLRTDRPLHVDHDHSCCPGDKRSCGDCVRGFICGPCNRGLGLFFDDTDALRRAADYLDS